jgi:hypothetical protein
MISTTYILKNTINIDYNILIDKTIDIYMSLSKLLFVTRQTNNIEVNKLSQEMMLIFVNMQYQLLILLSLLMLVRRTQNKIMKLIKQYSEPLNGQIEMEYDEIIASILRKEHYKRAQLKGGGGKNNRYRINRTKRNKKRTRKHHKKGHRRHKKSNTRSSSIRRNSHSSVRRSSVRRIKSSTHKNIRRTEHNIGYYVKMFIILWLRLSCFFVPSTATGNFTLNTNPDIINSTNTSISFQNNIGQIDVNISDFVVTKVDKNVQQISVQVNSQGEQLQKAGSIYSFISGFIDDAATSMASVLYLTPKEGLLDTVENMDKSVEILTEAANILETKLSQIKKVDDIEINEENEEDDDVYDYDKDEENEENEDYFTDIHRNSPDLINDQTRVSIPKPKPKQTESPTNQLVNIEDIKKHQPVVQDKDIWNLFGIVPSSVPAKTAKDFLRENSHITRNIHRDLQQVFIEVKEKCIDLIQQTENIGLFDDEAINLLKKDQEEEEHITGTSFRGTTKATKRQPSSSVGIVPVDVIKSISDGSVSAAQLVASQNITALEREQFVEQRVQESMGFCRGVFIEPYLEMKYIKNNQTDMNDADAPIQLSKVYLKAGIINGYNVIMPHKVLISQFKLLIRTSRALQNKMYQDSVGKKMAIFSNFFPDVSKELQSELNRLEDLSQKSELFITLLRQLEDSYFNFFQVNDEGIIGKEFELMNINLRSDIDKLHKLLQDYNVFLIQNKNRMKEDAIVIAQDELTKAESAKIVAEALSFAKKSRANDTIITAEAEAIRLEANEKVIKNVQRFARQQTDWLFSGIKGVGSGITGLIRDGIFGILITFSIPILLLGGVFLFIQFESLRRPFTGLKNMIFGSKKKTIADSDNVTTITENIENKTRNTRVDHDVDQDNDDGHTRTIIVDKHNFNDNPNMLEKIREYYQTHPELQNILFVAINNANYNTTLCVRFKGVNLEKNKILIESPKTGSRNRDAYTEIDYNDSILDPINNIGFYNDASFRNCIELFKLKDESNLLKPRVLTKMLEKSHSALFPDMPSSSESSKSSSNSSLSDHYESRRTPQFGQLTNTDRMLAAIAVQDRLNTLDNVFENTTENPMRSRDSVSTSALVRPSAVQRVSQPFRPPIPPGSPPSRNRPFTSEPSEPVLFENIYPEQNII